MPRGTRPNAKPSRRPIAPGTPHGRRRFDLRFHRLLLWSGETGVGQFLYAGTSAGGIVIIFGLILLLIGFVTGIAILWTIGVIVLIIGLVLWALGATGRAVGGRRHYF